MKTLSFGSAVCAGLLGLAGTGGPLRAGVLTETASSSPALVIPDNSAVGIADTLTLATPIQSINSVTVSLNLSGGYNGDLYAYLRHGTDFAVLLNRPGRTAGNGFGYADSGFQITLDDAAANGDIHNYQLTFNPAGGVLSGTWQPDGRDVPPAGSLDTSLRNATLSDFNTHDANGAWTLFLADASAVGTAKLDSWTLNVAGVVPEPAVTGLAMGLAAFFFCLWRRWTSPQPAR